MFLKIEFKHHLLLYSLSTTLWALFLLGGLSSEYYQTWSFLKALLIVDVMPLILLVPLSYYILKYVVGHHFVLSGVVAAFYGSVPLVIYDYIFIGKYLNKGMAFLTDYWYLTVFYFVPWAVIPLVGYAIERKRSRTTPREPDSPSDLASDAKLARNSL